MGSGLLKKANLLSKSKGLAFSNFIQKYNKKLFAIYSKQNDIYFATNSNGLDGDSLFSSYSTLDFWNGLIPERNKIYQFSEKENNLTQVLQLFSSKIKDKINNISIYKNESKILIICNSTISDQMIADFNLLDFTNISYDFNSINQSYLEKYSANKYVVQYKDAVKKFAESKNKPEIVDLLINAILNEISSRFSNYFRSPNCTIQNKEKNANIILFSEEEIEEELLKKQIQINLTEVIGEFSNLITVEFSGKAQNFNDLKNFLQVE